MKTYKHGEQTFAIIDGELWAKVAAVEADLEPQASQPVRSIGSITKRSRKQGKYSKANPMPESVKEQIHARRADGLNYNQLVQEFGVSRPTIERVLNRKPLNQTTKNKQVHDYVCANGHEFH